MNASNQKSINQEKSQAINRALIIDLLRQQGVCSRATLAHLSGLKQATITNIIAECITSGLVMETGLMSGSKGRRSIGITLNEEHCHVIGIRMTRSAFYLCLAGLSGKPFHVQEFPIAPGEPVQTTLPRIRRADDIDPSTFDNGISDDIFEKIVACIRVAVPYTGMIISTRESKACRERVLRLGVSQISGGSRTSVGGYAEEEPEEENSAQFDVSDNRTLDQVVRWLMELGYIPSFCTACYREGRTGDRFMSLCKSGQIQNCCHPNALMTLKEYLEDYAAPGTKEIGEKLIQAEIGSIPKEKVQEIVRKNLVEIEKGQRDFRF